jgi:hypothetical protein
LLAETEERASQDRLTALGERETAENRMYAGIVAGLAEQRRMEEDNWKHISGQFNAHQTALDEAHAKRMAQIEEQAALELLRLGHTEAEVQRILAEQRDTARRIGE